MLKLQFKNNPNRGFWLVGEQLSIGTAPSCHVVLAGLGVLEQHAVIEINGEVLTLLPVTGAQCLVNNKRVTEPMALRCHDEIRIGIDVLVVVDPKSQALKTSPQVNSKPQPLKKWSIKATHPKLQDRLFELEAKHVLGRSKDVDFFIPYKLLSREHVELTVLDEGVMLEDLNSANGCFVNDERVTRCLLTGGETLKFANLEFTVIAPQQVVSKPLPINATMIRQAISDDDIKQAQQDNHQRRGREAKHITAVELNETQSSPQYTIWLTVLTLLTLGLVAGWWFF